MSLYKTLDLIFFLLCSSYVQFHEKSGYMSRRGAAWALERAVAPTIAAAANHWPSQPRRHMTAVNTVKATGVPVSPTAARFRTTVVNWHEPNILPCNFQALFNLLECYVATNNDGGVKRISCLESIGCSFESRLAQECYSELNVQLTTFWYLYDFLLTFCAWKSFSIQ